MKIKKFIASIEIKRKITKVTIEAESIAVAQKRAKAMGKVISIVPKRGFDFEIKMDGERGRYFYKGLQQCFLLALVLVKP